MTGRRWVSGVGFVTVDEHGTVVDGPAVVTPDVATFRAGDVERFDTRKPVPPEPEPEV